MASRYNLLNANSPVANFARARIASRPDVAEGREKIPETSNGKPGRRDFLSRFYEAHRKDPEFMTHERVLAVTVANMFAGSDTTAITLRALFYNLLRHPDDMKSLMAELWAQKDKGVFQSAEDLVDWNDVRELPFLSAVIKETLRCHPAAGLTLERIVPAGGVTLCGEFIPAGTIVGCNAWTVHRDSFFGECTAEFRPQRWLDASLEQRRLMENSILSFGAGARTCIGKNISLLEIYKLVPAVLMRFEVSPSMVPTISQGCTDKPRTVGVGGSVETLETAQCMVHQTGRLRGETQVQEDKGIVERNLGRVGHIVSVITT